MASGYPPQAPEARSQPSRARSSARPDDAELLAPPEVDPVQLSRSMFSQPSPRPPPAPLTNLHLKKVARRDASITSGDAADAAGGTGNGGSGGRRSGGGGAGAGGGSAAARIRSARSARSARSVAASSVPGARPFSVVSDEEVIDVDGEPTTLADDDLDLPPSPGADVDEDEYGDAVQGGGGGGGGGGRRSRGPQRGGTLGMSGIAGLYGGDEYGGPDPLEELEADTPAVRLAEVTADLEVAMQSCRDPWVVVQLAQLALGHAKVVWRTMPVTVREEPLLLAKAHFSLARAYQGLGCDRQAADHGKQALAAIPKEVTDTEAARALRTEVQVMRAEALLSSAGVPDIPTEAACTQARKALVLLVKAAGLQEPVAWTTEEAEDNHLGGIQRSTIDSVTDGGIVALMAQSHGVLAEAKLKEAETEDAERKSSLRSAEEAACRLDRRTDRGDAFYSAEQLDKYRGQVAAFRDEADSHQAEVVRLAGEAERSYDAAMYCLNHVIDLEGSRLEESLGREGKVAHPTFQALWRRSLDFCAGIGTAYALQRKDAQRLQIVNEILSVYAQYGSSGWLPPARHIQALKDKGALLVDRRDYEGATSCYEELTDVVTELYGNDPVRRELQIAEVLKLRGDVALASGDFRTAQHKFNQALEYYQRHLGVQAPVAQDLLHRIDEVKGYLADTRVLGRLASMSHAPSSGSGGGKQSTPPAGSMTGGSAVGGSAGGGGGGGASSSSRSPAPSVISTRSNVSRPPPLAAASGSHRVSSVYGVPVAPAGGGRTPFDDGDFAAAASETRSVAGGAALSTASGPYSHRTASGLPGSATTPGASTPGGSQRPSSIRGSAPLGARASGTGSGSFRASGDGFSGTDGGAAADAPPASVAGSLQRRGSVSDVSGGHGWAVPAAASPAPSMRSYRSGDMGAAGPAAAAAASGGTPSMRSQRSGAGGVDDGAYGGAASSAALSHRSGFGAESGGGYGGARAPSPAVQSQRSGYGPAGGFDGGAASPAAQSHRSGYGAESGYGGAASPAVQSMRSGAGGGVFDGGAASPAAQSHRSGYGAESGFALAPSPAAQSQRSGYGAAGGFDGGRASPAAQSQRSGFDGGAASPMAQSQRSGYGGGGGGYDAGAASSAAPPSQRSGYSGAASPALQSHRSGSGFDGGYGGGAAAAPASVTQSLRSADFTALRGYGSTAGSQPRASGADFDDDEAEAAGSVADEAYGGGDVHDHVSSTSPSIASAARRLAASRASGELSTGGAAPLASPSARSQRSGVSGAAANGFDVGYGGLASPSARSQRSGAGYDGGYGGALSPAAPSHRSGLGSGSAAGGFDGGRASSAAQSHRSGFGTGGFDTGFDAASPAAFSQRSGFGAAGGGGGGFDGGAASPAALSQRSGFGGYGGGGGSVYGGAAAPAAPMSQRSGEFGLGKTNSRSSLSRSNNDPMEF